MSAFGERYHVWLQLDFKEKEGNDRYKMYKYRDLHGFSLEKVLDLYPIQEMRDPKLREAIIQSLKKGNSHPVHFVKSKKTELKLIEANARNRTINIYSPGVLKNKSASRSEAD